MNKDQFWTVNKLLPQVRVVGTNHSERSCGVPISDLSETAKPLLFGDKISVKNSKVIQYYRLCERCSKNVDHPAPRSFSTQPLFAPCTQFAPSFASLDRKQQDYYLFFCDMVKNEKKVSVSFPYIRLYLAQEIRNCKIDGTISRKIFWLWKNYRKDFPLADKLFSDYISDLSLYLKIELPFEELGEVFCQNDFTSRPFVLNQYVFDYLFSEAHTFTHREKEFVLRTMTRCNFRNSKAYRHHSKFSSLAEDVIEKAFSHGVFNKKHLNDTLLGIRIPSSVRTARKLFLGLPVGEIPDVDIVLEHFPLMFDENVHDRCDEVVRYLENRIRSILKIKNSLSRIHISHLHKGFLEGILSEYEKFAPTSDGVNSAESTNSTLMEQVFRRELNIDFEAANKIENDSRNLTRILTEDLEFNETESVLIGETSDEREETQEDVKEEDLVLARPINTENDFWEFAAALTEAEDKFVSTALYFGCKEARRFAMTNGMFFEALIASCNEKAKDATGDSIFAQNGEIYSDYRDSLMDVFQKTEGESL